MGPPLRDAAKIEREEQKLDCFGAVGLRGGGPGCHIYQPSVRLQSDFKTFSWLAGCSMCAVDGGEQ